MRLIRGVAGAGKTALVLREFKQALAASQADSRTVRIIVPTATLVRHIQHELARDLVVFSPSCIVSLTRFAQERAPEIQLVPDPLLREIVRDCLQRISLPEFAGVASTEGMIATVTDTISLFENAACTPDRLAAVRRLTPDARAFEKLWRAVDQAVHAAGHHTRADLMRAAAANPARARIWMDGFITFSPSEGVLLRALSQTCDLTLTLTDSPATDEARRLALQLRAEDRLLSGTSRKPATEIFQASTVEREVDEIARRILSLNARGTQFRRIGIALRDKEAYLPVLRTAFDRFGIPARFYFSHELRMHPAARFLGGLVHGALDDWDFETTLQVLRCHPRWGSTAEFDRFDVTVREAMPGRGSGPLLKLCESEWLRNQISECVATDLWKHDSHTPSAWQKRLESFAATLYRPGTPGDPADHLASAAARSHAAALKAWQEAVRSVVPFWADPEKPVTLDEFWRVASSAVEGAVFRATDNRANVVHVMTAEEARQWDVDAMFVCGVVDRDFPRRYPRNLLFADEEVERLNKAGILLRKPADLESDESGLFESLRTRAAECLYLSFPLHDASGKSSQPSRFLDAAAAIETALPCRPERRAQAAAPGLSGRIRAADLLAEMARLHQSIGLTSLEDHLAKCRFRFFGAKTLALTTMPEAPGERLSARVTGSIMHAALERWLADRTQNFVQVFEATFDDFCQEQHLAPGYHLEVKRIEFRKIAQNVSASELWNPDSSQTEVELVLEFPGGVKIKCRIDRIDTFGGDCVIIDYKSGKTKNVEALVESGTALQGPLYALAVREHMNLNPVAMLYWAVRDDKLHGWGHIPGTTNQFAEMPPNWSINARERIVERLAGFLNGEVHAHPEEKANCRWCDFANACRVEQRALVMIEGAHGS